MIREYTMTTAAAAALAAAMMVAAVVVGYSDDGQSTGSANKRK